MVTVPFTGDDRRSFTNKPICKKDSCISLYSKTHSFNIGFLWHVVVLQYIYKLLCYIYASLVFLWKLYRYCGGSPFEKFLLAMTPFPLPVKYIYDDNGEASNIDFRGTELYAYIYRQVKPMLQHCICKLHYCIYCKHLTEVNLNYFCDTPWLSPFMQKSDIGQS